MKPLSALRAIVACAAALICSVAVPAQGEFGDQTFLSDYSLLEPMPSREGREGKDFFYLAPGTDDKVVGKYTKVMVDQPEVHLSPDSPYRGAKASDLAAVSGLFHASIAAALKDRGFAVVDQPGPDTLYLRVALTDLQIAKHKKGFNPLAYTPVGLVVTTGMKALQEFMDKYDILDIAVQTEAQDSQTGKVLGAVVIRRSPAADKTKPIRFDAMALVMNEQSERFACRLENGRLPADQKIDCFDPVARKSRPRFVTP